MVWRVVWVIKIRDSSIGLSRGKAVRCSS